MCGSPRSWMLWSTMSWAGEILKRYWRLRCVGGIWKFQSQRVSFAAEVRTSACNKVQFFHSPQFQLHYFAKSAGRGIWHVLWGVWRPFARQDKLDHRGQNPASSSISSDNFSDRFHSIFFASSFEAIELAPRGASSACCSSSGLRGVVDTLTNFSILWRTICSWATPPAKVLRDSTEHFQETNRETILHEIMRRESSTGSI